MPVTYITRFPNVKWRAICIQVDDLNRTCREIINMLVCASLVTGELIFE